MKVYGDVERVDLATGECFRRVSGDGESRVFSCCDHKRLGPGIEREQEMERNASREVSKIVEELKRRNKMHYRNGREAKNGDKIVKLEGGKVVAYGVLHSATPGNDYCNGNIAVVQPANDYACMVDCLHVDDVAGLLAEKELDKRPPGK
jgi:hypothetical protein